MTRLLVWLLILIASPLPLSGQEVPGIDQENGGKSASLMPLVQVAMCQMDQETDRAGRVGAGTEDLPVLWYFWRGDCPVCQRAEPWLEEMKTAYQVLEIRKVDVLRDLAGRALFERMMNDRGTRASAVPTFILGDQFWVGFTRPLAEEMEAVIRRRLGKPPGEISAGRATLDLGPLGQVDVGKQPMFMATILIAFVDGFNPCSLWVLTVLLAMILGTRSRVRIAAVGLTFLLVTPWRSRWGSQGVWPSLSSPAPPGFL